jgi:ribosomal protein L11 methyltransferase
MVENQMLYFQTVLTCSLLEKEQLSAYFLEQGANCVTETNITLHEVTLTVIHPIKEMIRNKIPDAIVTPLDLNLEYKWMDHYTGFYCCKNIYIHPSHLQEPNTLEKEDIIITIDPKDAFGDGRHPTTKHCSELLKECCENKSNKSLCDIGTGTGILAICAEKMGISQIDAFDISEKSIENARKNADLNNCKNITLFIDKIETFTPNKTYDIVVANLLTIIIETNIITLIKCLAINGTLILSGIGEQWKGDIEKIFKQHNLEIINYINHDGWLAFELKKER